MHKQVDSTRTEQGADCHNLHGRRTPIGWILAAALCRISREINGFIVFVTAIFPLNDVTEQLLQNALEHCIILIAVHVYM